MNLNELNMQNINIEQLKDVDKINAAFVRAESFIELMMYYRCALKTVQTKFEVLNEEFSVRYNRNPVESIKTRIKSPFSIIDKLKRRNLDISLESIRSNINDVAGIRIICSFPEDIYFLSDMLTRQDDVIVVCVKDYIMDPKPNGYRSLHLIIEVPVFFTENTEYVKVEVQFRTIAMDFWASLEHKLRYKKSISDNDQIAVELKQCAEGIAAMDLKMQDIHHKIEES